MRAPIILALLLVPAAASGADAALAAVFQRMDRASLAFKGFTAELVKIDHQNFVDATDKSVGAIAVRKSGPHSIQVLETIATQNGNPDGEQMELTASHFSIYHPKTNMVTEYDLGKKYRGMEEAALALLGGTSKDLQQDYKVAYGGPDSIDGQPCARLILSPIEPQLAQTFPKIEVWISDASGIAIQEEFYEKGALDYHIQTYSHMKFAPVSEDQIKMKVPKDAKKERPH